MSGIETFREGVTFRSRLEARWAMFFNLIQWRWTYEPFDADGYIPDFLVHGDRPLLVEVKPAATLKELETHGKRLERALRDWNHDVLLVGVSPQLDENPIYPLAGVMLEREDEGFVLDEARWHRCLACSRTSVHAAYLDYASRLCGHYDADRLWGPLDISLKWAWRAVCDPTRWVAAR